MYVFLSKNLIDYSFENKKKFLNSLIPQPQTENMEN